MNGRGATLIEQVIFVAEAAVPGLSDERFPILPHPEVAECFRRKASHYDRRLRGMRRLQASIQ